MTQEPNRNNETKNYRPKEITNELTNGITNERVTRMKKQRN